MHRIKLITFPLLATMAIAAQANTPPDVDDLTGMRSSSAERELEDRGYHHRKTLEIGSAKVAYWWQSRNDRCIAVTNKDGHVKSVVSQNQKMCDSNSSGSSSHGSSDLRDLVDMRASSGERELEDMGYDHRKTVTFGGGKINYWWNSRQDKCIAVNVNDGRFTAVTDQPDSMCDEDDKGSSGHHGGGHDLNHLVDMRASSGERELEDMGYDHRKTVTFGGGKIGYWWNSRERHCIAINVNDGRFTAVTDQPGSMCDESDKGSGGHHGGGHGLQSLVGMRASSGEKELEDRGYKFMNSSKGDDRIWSNWWNRSEKKCITVVTMDGRYDAVTDTLPADCGKN